MPATKKMHREAVRAAALTLTTLPFLLGAGGAGADGASENPAAEQASVLADTSLLVLSHPCSCKRMHPRTHSLTHEADTMDPISSISRLLEIIQGIFRFLKFEEKSANQRSTFQPRRGKARTKHEESFDDLTLQKRPQ
jgi:hypothetical protein